MEEVLKGIVEEWLSRQDMAQSFIVKLKLIGGFYDSAHSKIVGDRFPRDIEVDVDWDREYTIYSRDLINEMNKLYKTNITFYELVTPTDTGYKDSHIVCGVSLQDLLRINLKLSRGGIARIASKVYPYISRKVSKGEIQPVPGIDGAIWDMEYRQVLIQTLVDTIIPNVTPMKEGIQYGAN